VAAARRTRPLDSTAWAAVATAAARAFAVASSALAVATPAARPVAAARTAAGRWRVLAASVTDATSVVIGYYLNATARMAMSAIRSAQPHSGMTMPHRRLAVKNEMTITKRATTRAP